MFSNILFSHEITRFFPRSYLKPDLKPEIFIEEIESWSHFEREKCQISPAGAWWREEQRGELSFPSPRDFVNVELRSRPGSATLRSKGFAPKIKSESQIYPSGSSSMKK